jgi:hypothetical protein
VTHRRTALAATLVLAQLAMALPAMAQSPSDKALAQSLFDEGKKLMGEEKYAEACPKLAESQKLDPGGGTLLNLAVCHQKEGKTATAWAEFEEALSQAKKEGRAEREAFAREHIAEIEPKLSRLTIAVTPAAANVAGLQVKLDGGAIGKAAWGAAIPVDPGKHTLEATAPGKKTWTGDVEIGADADKKSIEVPALADAPAEAPKTTTTNTTTDVTPSNQKTIGFIVGGVGVVALGVGAVFGIRSFSKWSERNDNCPNDVCNAKAKEAADSATTSANIANVGVGVGLVAIGVGAFLILTAPSAPEKTASKPLSIAKNVQVTPGALPGGGFIGLSGAF